VNEFDDDVLAAYVHAVSALTRMPLSAERETAIAGVLKRIAGFAADLEAFELGDDVDIAGVFTP
jgi:hypothetical protein